MLMTKLFSLLLILMVGGSKSSNPTPLVDESVLQENGLRTFWSATLPLKKGDSIDEAFLVDEVLYVISDQGSLFSIKKDVGLIRWGMDLTEADYTIFKPTHIRNAEGTGALVVPTTTATFIIDRYNARQLQRFTTSYPTSGAAIAHENLIFTGSSNGRMYSLKMSTTGSHEPFVAWEVATGGPITTSPVFAGWDQLVFASQSGQIFSCNASNKALRWSFDTRGVILGDPAVDDTGAYVASQSRSLYKVDINHGRVAWRVRFPRPLHDGPVVTSGTVYQFCDRDGLSALDAGTGELKWKRTNGSKLAAHNKAGDVIYTNDKNLEVVDHETGQVLSTIELNDPIDVLSNTTGDGIYILGSGGQVLCVNLDDVPYLRRQQVLAAEKQLNLPPVTMHNEASGRSTSNASSTSTSNDPLRSQRDTKP